MSTSQRSPLSSYYSLPLPHQSLSVDYSYTTAIMDGKPGCYAASNMLSAYPGPLTK
jgi:hypothetical protein